MGRRRNSSKQLRWAFLLAVGCALWAASGVGISLYLGGHSGPAGLAQCAASIGYLVALMIVMAIGVFTRVRTLLTLETLYGLAVLVRASIGLADALMFLDLQVPGWLDMLVRPFGGLEYLSIQLTAHFVTELYWLGLALSATILIFLSIVARMAATAQLARQAAYARTSPRTRPRTHVRR